MAASGKLPSQSGRLRALVTVPAFPVHVARGADADPRERPRLDAGGLGGLGQRANHRVGDVLRAARGRRLVPGLAQHAVVVAHDDRLDLRSAEVDAAALTHARKVPVPGWLTGQSGPIPFRLNTGVRTTEAWPWTSTTPQSWRSTARGIRGWLEEHSDEAPVIRGEGAIEDERERWPRGARGSASSPRAGSRR